MAVPEAPVHEDHETIAREYEIRTSGKIGAVQSEPESETMQQPSDDQLGLGVARANSRHHPTSMQWIDDVH